MQMWTAGRIRTLAVWAGNSCQQNANWGGGGGGNPERRFVPTGWQKGATAEVRWPGEGQGGA